MIEHHAVLCVGRHETDLATFCPSAAEIIPFVTTTLTIGEVRRLIALAYQTPGGASYRVLVVTAEALAPEAQQALLKVLEEPPATTRFVFHLPSVAGILPTVLSRLHVVATTPADLSDATAFTEFRAMTLVDRLEQIATAAKKKDEGYFQALSAGLEVALVSLPRTLQLPLHQCLLHLGLRGASKKMVWEEIALTLPVGDAA